MSAGPADRTFEAGGVRGWTAGSGLRAERVDQAGLETAATTLIGATAGPSGRSAARRFLASAGQQGIDLSRFWVVRGPASRGERPLAAALLAPSSGGTGMLFTSEPGSAEESRALEAAVGAVCANPEGVRLAQSLLEPEQTALRELIAGCGFRHVGDLLYMRRPWRPVPPGAGDEAWPKGVEVRNWREGDDADVMRALERSYIDTLDCPELCGIRRTADVLASHRGAGSWSPDLWWLVYAGGEPEGVVLVNEFPAQRHAELVYIGLGPALRGRGLGEKLVRRALRALGSRRCRELTCAVDERNAPALVIYERLGFETFASRVALVKPTG